ncbi:MAG: imidazoleglycerol-phosphate dehydratase HisB [Candidatus Hadarchaeota archaeon]|nr:imidazoleglycerol-phosphate dehydratase HisB [Candidatus Hadarchaeota archaeon]
MRVGKIRRKTKETKVEVRVNLDGSGKADVDTSIRFLDHLLGSFAKHGCVDLKVKARGNFKHHVAEDVMIVLGTAIDRALGRKVGIRRMGDAIVPMDDALALAAIDLGGRAYPRVDLKFRGRKLADLDLDLVEHLLETLATNGKFNLHVKLLRGRNDHHKVEAIFKALGVALSDAVSKRSRAEGVSSTKGVI